MMGGERMGSCQVVLSSRTGGPVRPDLSPLKLSGVPAPQQLSGDTLPAGEVSNIPTKKKKSDLFSTF